MYINLPKPPIGGFFISYYLIMKNRLDLTTDDSRMSIMKEFFGHNAPDNRHNFRISPDTAPLSQVNLDLINQVAYSMPDFIAGALKLSQISLINDRLRRVSPTFRFIRRLLELEPALQEIMKQDKLQGIDRGMERDMVQEIKVLEDSELPGKHPFVRLDCIIEGESGGIKIVEIEEAKLHGLGYATLCRMLGGIEIGEGLVSRFVELTKDKPGLIILSNSERFYLTEQNFFARRVNEEGGNLTVGMQENIAITEEGILVRNEYGRFIQCFTNIINIPRFSGNSINVASLNKAINHLYSIGIIDVVSHRRDFLGEKSLLALISNPYQEKELEEILMMCFDTKTLNLLRTLIPRTFIPRNRVERDNVIGMIRDGQKFFIKEVDASGARGVASFQDSMRQIELINKGHVIVQDAISPEMVPMRHSDLFTGESGRGLHTVRYGCFIVKRGLEAVAATASPSLIAHGGVTSIQTGIHII